MALVPGATTTVVYFGQRWNGFARQQVDVEPFCVDVFEASQPDATQKSPGSWVWNRPVPAAQSKRGVLPWTDITFNQAAEACQKAGKRLPTLAEWQTAFSGVDGSPWPWGDAWRTNTCYVGRKFGVFPTGGCCFEIAIGNESFEVCDMVGNVSEWVNDLWDPACDGADRIMIAGGAAHTDPTLSNGQQRAETGAKCWRSTDYSLERFALHEHNRESGYFDDGFRCAKSLKPTP